jgi:hypothetical protein
MLGGTISLMVAAVAKVCIFSMWPSALVERISILFLETSDLGIALDALIVVVVAHGPVVVLEQYMQSLTGMELHLGPVGLESSRPSRRR